MTHRLSLPTDAEMENLIMQVYESLPNPDQSRLSLIESKLLQKEKKRKSQKNLNKIPWWIVLVLASGFASAVWWAGELFFDEQSTENRDKQLSSNDKIIEMLSNIDDVDSNSTNNNENNKINEGKSSPIIYQRESL